MNTYGLAEEQYTKAIEKYYERFDGVLYDKAIQGRPHACILALLRDADALCGSPFHKMRKENWDKDALAFLQLFVD